MDEWMLDALVIGVACSVLGFVGFIIRMNIMNKAIRQPGQKLRQQMVGLGTLRGRPLSEIEATCGAAQSVTYTGDGSIRVWSQVGYTICLTFDNNNICTGVSSETSA